VFFRQLVHTFQLTWAYLNYSVWYLAVEILLAYLATAWIVYRCLHGLVTRRPALGLPLTVLLLGLLTVPLCWRSAGDLGKIRRSPPDRTLDAQARMAALRWAEANLPADSRLGSFNSGLLHWVAARPVLNLDGRVSRGDLAPLVRAGTPVLHYVRTLGVTHVIDRIYDDRSPFGRFWQEVSARGEILVRFPVQPSPEADIVVVQLPAG
jgi:hypothetical protein